jgi:hypothetical protein
MEVEVEDVEEWWEGTNHLCGDGRGQCTAENGKPKLIGIRKDGIQVGTR